MAGNQCKTLTFENKHGQILGVVQRFSKQCSCHCQGEREWCKNLLAVLREKEVVMRNFSDVEIMWGG
jgi:hypothetical protein